MKIKASELIRQLQELVSLYGDKITSTGDNPVDDVYYDKEEGEFRVELINHKQS